MTPEFSFAYHLIYYLDFLSLLLALLTLRAIALRLPDVSFAAANFTPLAFCVLLPTAFLVGAYFYDFPELLFLSLGYLLALRRRYWLLLLLVPVASLNKETALLLPALVSPILLVALGRRRTIVYVLVGTALGLAATLAVRVMLDLTRGSPAILHLFHNVWFWLHPSSYFQFTDILAPGIPFPKPGNLIFLGTLAAMIAYGWKSMPIVERQLLVVAAALNIPLALLFGAPAEFRNLSLMFVPVVIACIRFFSQAQRVNGRVANVRTVL